ncbi:MAG: glycoside hydrolase TIM-barrel-like domain-containing protein [Rhodosalinus sp.]
MATILLSAAGAALGSSLGGTVLGLSMTAAGRFLGATAGRAIDQRLLGEGSEAVETGRLERIRLTGAGEGDPVPRLWGRMRLGGHVIWASRFTEIVTTEGGGGKGAPRRPEIRRHSYRVSLAIALCEGVIAGVGRVWADGAEIAPADLEMRVHTGARDQMPDPLIEAIEGAGQAPAYRGTAYVVLEDLDLSPFGNRVPQFSFEVIRHEQPDRPGAETDVAGAVRGVALIPGTGEYALATRPVAVPVDKGRWRMANVNTPLGVPDLPASLDALSRELPACGAVSLVVSWFGDDLRCGACTLRPLVEQTGADGRGMPWTVSGLARAGAGLVPMAEGRALYGGTPADASVVQALRALRESGRAAMFYPFVLMTQTAGNALPDPWTGAEGQPALPWRGRITASVAPGRAGSPDGTAQANAEIAAFFGTARAADFTVGEGEVAYHGPEEWGFRRFILHYAALCAAAGGVEAFCIGSEMRGLTQIRGATGFPAVEQMRTLAAEVRALLGPETKIGYAADWTEYRGYQPPGAPEDFLFHLDPLWADANIDFIGIDNYMPLSDWRDGPDHLDAGWGAIHDLGYLTSNVAGGEGYDWYYHSDEARAAQIRTAITDGAHDEPWVWRVKDIRGWWENAHHDRVGGVRQPRATAWEPRSKPFWFTEIGCAAIDKGTNQPNKFLDPKSSESALPHFSDGRRDETIQAQYIRAVTGYWTDPANNPVSDLYGGRMVDMDRCFVWAWDARPWPWFPANRGLWSDGANHARGHWLNGRGSGRSLSSVVGEICDAAGLAAYDTRRLFGHVRGYLTSEGGTARAALQPLMLAHAFDAVERDGALHFLPRETGAAAPLDPERLAESPEIDGTLERSRAAEAEQTGRLRVRFTVADGDFEAAAEEAILPGEPGRAVTEAEVPLALTRAEAKLLAERWLAEAQVARDGTRFALPPSAWALGAGDVVQLEAARYRIDRVEQGEARLVEAVRIEPSVYRPAEIEDMPERLAPFVPAVPVTPLFLDLPLLRGDEVPHAPHLAVTAAPWPGRVALYEAAQDAGYALSDVIEAQAAIGVTESPLAAAPPGRIDRGPALRVRMLSGTLSATDDAGLLAGRNLLAVGDGSTGVWELLQARDAQLIAPGVWLLSHRLRGQAGSDGIVPAVWPEGSWVVAMNGVPRQIALSPAFRDVARHWRIGPAGRGYDDPSYEHRVLAFKGEGLRPYRPCHLRLTEEGGGLRARWVRRTRIDGDGWAAPEVPLGEEAELYLVRITGPGGAVLREVQSAGPDWLYPAAQRAADAGAGPRRIEVAQVSARYGPGPFASAPVPG